MLPTPRSGRGGSNESGERKHNKDSTYAAARSDGDRGLAIGAAACGAPPPGGGGGGFNPTECFHATPNLGNDMIFAASGTSTTYASTNGRVPGPFSGPATRSIGRPCCPSIPTWPLRCVGPSAHRVGSRSCFQLERSWLPRTRRCPAFGCAGTRERARSSVDGFVVPSPQPTLRARSRVRHTSHLSTYTPAAASGAGIRSAKANREIELWGDVGRWRPSGGSRSSARFWPSH